jgi:hypothetical protein
MSFVKGAHMSMFSRVAIAFAAAAALTPIAPVHAQESVDLVAHVPFQFTVGGSTLPRDTYQLSRLHGHAEMLLVRGERKGVVIRTEPVRTTGRDSEPLLVFHRYGDQYFLREVRLEGNGRLDLPETKAERDAAEGRADRAAVPMEPVVIGAERR